MKFQDIRDVSNPNRRTNDLRILPLQYSVSHANSRSLSYVSILGGYRYYNGGGYTWGGAGNVFVSPLQHNTNTNNDKYYYPSKGSKSSKSSKSKSSSKGKYPTMEPTTHFPTTEPTRHPTHEPTATPTHSPTTTLRPSHSSKSSKSKKGKKGYYGYASKGKGSPNNSIMWPDMMLPGPGKGKGWWKGSKKIKSKKSKKEGKGKGYYYPKKSKKSKSSKFVHHFPTTAPSIAVPTQVPATVPTRASVSAPTQVPVAVPTQAPAAVPTRAPVSSPPPVEVPPVTDAPVTQSPAAQRTTTDAPVVAEPTAITTEPPVSVSTPAPSPGGGETPSPDAGVTPSPVSEVTPSPDAGTTPSPVSEVTPSPVAETTPSPSISSTTASPDAGTPAPSATGATPSPTAEVTDAPTPDAPDLLVPTTAPSFQQTTTEAPTAPFIRDPTPFSVTYDNVESGGTPSEEDYAEAAEVTVTYLEEFLKSSLAFEDSYLESLNLTVSGIGTGPVRIGYFGDATFSEESTFVPTQEQLDELIDTALQQPISETLLMMLNNLPEDNPFSKTTNVEYSNSAQPSEPEPLATQLVSSTGIVSAVIGASVVVVAVAAGYVSLKHYRIFAVKDRSGSNNNNDDRTEVVMTDNEEYIQGTTNHLRTTRSHRDDFDDTRSYGSDDTSLVDAPSVSLGMGGYGRDDFVAIRMPSNKQGIDDDDDACEITFEPSSRPNSSSSKRSKRSSRSDPLFQSPFMENDDDDMRTRFTR